LQSTVLLLSSASTGDAHISNSFEVSKRSFGLPADAIVRVQVPIHSYSLDDPTRFFKKNWGFFFFLFFFFFFFFFFSIWSQWDLPLLISWVSAFDNHLWLCIRFPISDILD